MGRKDHIRAMFDRIAPKYDLLNRLISGFSDLRWRREAVRLLDAGPRDRILDVCTGTGDLLMALVNGGGFRGRGVGLDFSLNMMGIAKRKFAGTGFGGLDLICGNAESLPFRDSSFDGAMIGFGLRNVEGIERAVSEMARVVRPGGRVVILEIARPANPFFRWFYGLYFHRFVPWLGGIISGDHDAYTYLPRSTLDFPLPSELRGIMERVGLRDVRYILRGGGVVAIHAGVKRL
ncbi:MAG: ubiquinone/menaquinone biosynthesis methyltransferase [bacterium]